MLEGDWLFCVEMQPRGAVAEPQVVRWLFVLIEM